MLQSSGSQQGWQSNGQNIRKISVDVGQERFCPIRLGMVEEVFRRSFFGDLAAVEEDDARGDVPCEGKLMRDDDHRHAVFGQGLHDLEDLADHLRVQGGSGFVEEHDVGIHDQGPGDGDALLLPSRQSPGHVGRKRSHAHLFKGVHRSSLGLFLAPFEDLSLGIETILEDIHVLEEVELLEDHPHPGADLVDVASSRQEIFAFEKDLALVRPLKQVETAKEGGLASAGRADDGDDVALLDIQGDSLQYRHALVAFLEGTNLQQNFSLTHLSLLSDHRSRSSFSVRPDALQSPWKAFLYGSRAN